MALAFEVTQGQLWLVNALGYQLTRKMNIERRIEAAHVERAKELRISSRSTHLDSLADKLNEPRVRAVVEPILAGGQVPMSLPMRDIEYCIDLGILARDPNAIRIANPIYREVLPRELTQPTQIRIVAPTRRWALPGGRLDLPGLLQALVAFWRENGELMVVGQDWPEAAHQIVLMAFLQRVVNGGGTIEREYGLGRGRLDLLIRWALTTDEYGGARTEERHAIEVKVWRDGQKDPLPKGLEQLDGYLERLGLSEGTLILFDARSGSPTGEDWETRGSFAEESSPGGRRVTVLRL